MKSFVVVLLLLLSMVTHAGPRSSQEVVNPVVAELMGDVLYFQLDNSSKSLHRINAMVDKAKGLASVADSEVQGAFLESVVKLMYGHKARGRFDPEQLKNVSYHYERLVNGERQAVHQNPALLMLDLRYRYLAMTLPSLSAGNILVVPLQYSLEDSLSSVDSRMAGLVKATAADQLGRKWAFIKTRVSDYNNRPIPALANNMLLNIATELQGRQLAMR